MPRGTLSFRTETVTCERLDALAALYRRDRSFPINEAIEAWLAAEERAVAAIRAGIEDADRGDVVPHEAVTEWIRSWTAEHPAPIPETSTR
jgi:predicted transcriptional regulator